MLERHTRVKRPSRTQGSPQIYSENSSRTKGYIKIARKQCRVWPPKNKSMLGQIPQIRDHVYFIRKSQRVPTSVDACQISSRSDCGDTHILDGSARAHEKRQKTSTRKAAVHMRWQCTHTRVPVCVRAFLCGTFNWVECGHLSHTRKKKKRAHARHPAEAEARSFWLNIDLTFDRPLFKIVLRVWRVS